MITAIETMHMEIAKNQMLQAFNRGKMRSDDPSIIGNRILPNPPINIGMIMKKIMNRPWKDIALLYCCDDDTMNPMMMTSQRIDSDSANPTEPPMAPLAI